MTRAVAVSQNERSLPSAATIWTASLLVLSIVLGGGTKAGFLSDAVLQIFAAPFIIIAFFSLGWKKLSASGRAAVVIAAAMVGVALLQLVPFPIGWRGGPPDVFLTASVTGEVPAGDAFRPLSTSSRATVLALLAGLPALAIFLGICGLSTRERRDLTLIVLVVGLASSLLGLLQVAQGPSSPLRFFSITNPTEAVGFFANRNHFSAFLYAVLLLGAAWAADAAQRWIAAPAGRRFDADLMLPALSSLTVMTFLVAMQMFARSRAGLGLTIIALLGIGALALRLRGGKGWSSVRVILGAGAFGILITIQFALYRILERFEGDPLADARIPFARNTIEAARTYFPFGSGVGTFVEIYGMFERPRDALRDVFANRAHNDFLEMWLETGLLGAAVLLAFVVWFALACIAAWRRPTAGRATLDVALTRAASLIVMLLLLHSLVDYPLRTAAMLGVFAMACALLVPPLDGTEHGGGDASHSNSMRHRARSAVAMEAAMEHETRPSRIAWPGAMEPPPSASETQVPTQTARGRPWGEGVAWPSEWQTPGGATSGHPNASGPAVRTRRSEADRD